MLKYYNYDIVFQEVPGEVTLAINITNCPNRCEGCHSPHLRKDIGEVLNGNSLTTLLGKYGNAITCICFMGGDASPKEIEKLSLFVREQTERRIKTAWYSGKESFPKECFVQSFNYIKLGPYIPSLGGLDSTTTNQHFYQITNGKMIDTTNAFQKKAIAAIHFTP